MGSNSGLEAEKVKVLIVDDHTLFAEGTVSLLSSEPRILAVGIAKNGMECMELISQVLPDVVLLDINLPDICGTNLIAKIKRTLPAAKIVMLTGQNPQGYVNKSISKGANGFLLKECSVKEMTQAILKVYEGGNYFAQSLDDFFQSEKTGITPPMESLMSSKLLTAREIEIMELIAKGLHNKEIATALGIKVRTVDFHVYNILIKLGVSSRLEAVLIWVKEVKKKFR
jgi:DNA-binding NarL/FixJ family response regulator